MIQTRDWMWRRSSSWQQSRLPNALAFHATRTLQPQGARSPMTEAVAVTPRRRHRAHAERRGLPHVEIEIRRCDCSPPGVHRLSAKHTVRLG